MDPPLVNETSFSAANPPPYTLTELWPFPAIDGDPETCSVPGGLGLRIGNLGSWFVGDRGQAAEESSGKEQSGGGNAKKGRELSSEDESSKLVSTPSSGNELNDSNRKRRKVSGSRNEITNTKSEIQASSAANNKPAEQSSTLHEPPKQDYIHVRARRGQATDSHSLAERVIRFSLLKFATFFALFQLQESEPCLDG
ncbi:hypothetical protein Tsubulata_006688 [Turnera subulata]|uniref:Uncharacterized protein n=1 Tax=Turnera subulata TaxID=218843 RepID=A0A9Q0JQD7_9ROSI|nr:hypothetical protein Tsubulata_006688 [Turnera subulata]